MSDAAQCEDCKREVPNYDTIHTTVAEQQSRLVCTRCFNAVIAKQSGVDFVHPDFAPITLEDAAGRCHQFHFRTRQGGDHMAVDAFEVEDGIPAGYQFQVLGDPEQDPLEIFQQLLERMRRALARRHIEKGDLGPKIAESDEGWIVRGQLEWDERQEGRLPRLIVDGESYSWDEVGRMLMSFEGLQVKLEVYDPSEER
jgi:hypothetical protein